MTKEKIISLTKYMEEMWSKLNGDVPAKHKGHPESYKRFLRIEYEAVKKVLDLIKLEGGAKK